MTLAADIQAELIRVTEKTLEGLISEFQDELKNQGHVLTGRLYNSMEFKISASENEIIGTIFFEDYGTFVETGVPANRIPFSGTSGRGGTSKYIQGLIRFFQLRGVAGAEAIRAAFATAQKHKREGMPTRASSRFSKTGERTGFINRRLQSAEPRILAAFQETVGNAIEIRIVNVFQEAFAA